MLIGHKLSLLCKLLKGFLLQDSIISSQIVKNLRLKHHVAGINRYLIGDILFTECFNGVVLANVQHPFALILQNCCQCRNSAMLLVESHSICNIYIADRIAICKQKSLIPNVFLHSLQTSASHSIKTSINDSHLPGLHMSLMDRHFILSMCIIEGHIADSTEIIAEPVLNKLLLITRTYDKFIKPIPGILFHDVPHNRHSPNINHRFWSGI